MTLPSGVSLLTVYPSDFGPQEGTLGGNADFGLLPNFKVPQSQEQRASVIRVDDPEVPVDRAFNLNGTQWVTSRSPAVTPVFSVDLYFRVLNIDDQTNQNGFLFSTILYANGAYPYFGNGIKIIGNNIRAVSGGDGSSLTNTGALTGPVGTWQRFTCQWRDNRLYIYLNGSLVADVYNFLQINTATPPYNFVTVGASTYDRSGGFRGDIAQVRFFYGDIPVEDILAYDDTPFQIREDGVNCLRMDEQACLSEPLLIDYSKWVVGQPPPPEFTMSGTSAENQIVSDVDPWGKTVPHWRAFPDAISGPSGGFSVSVPASPEETYRMSVFIRRDVIAGSGDGMTYFSCQSSAGKLLKANDLSDITNPIFRGWLPDTTEWLLWVGYCHRANSPAGVTSHKSGVYTMEGDLVLNATEFVLPAGITDVIFRVSLSDGTTVNSRQSYLYPRIDVVDGSEPSINELLAGYDSNIYDTVKAQNNTPAIKVAGIKSNNEFTEIGVTRGLKLYLPFTEDKNDYWKGMHSLVDTGNAITYDNSVPPITGALFQNTTNTQYLSIPLADLGIESGKDFTVTFLSRVTSTPPAGTLFSLYDNVNNQPGISHHFRLGLTYNLRMNPVGSVSEVGQLSSAISTPDTWVFFVVSLNSRTGKITQYRQNLNAIQSAPFEITAVQNLVYDELQIAVGLNNIISEFKVFNVALTSAEMVTEYLRNTAIASVGKGIIQTSGTFNEL